MWERRKHTEGGKEGDTEATETWLLHKFIVYYEQKSKLNKCMSVRVCLPVSVFVNM